MNSSRLLFAGSLFAAALLSSCAIPLTTSQINRQVCVAHARSSYDAQSKLPMKIVNVSVATGGSRVVVEGQIADPNAPKPKHGLAKLFAAHGSAASGASAVAASSAGPASAADAASSAYAVPPGNAGAECLFAGRQLTAFQWLAPAALAKKDAAAK